MLSKKQKIGKRIFDLFFSLIGIIIFSIPICILVILATISTGRIGFFSQLRVGQHKKLFRIFKIRTMKSNENRSPITLKNDNRFTKFGKYISEKKLDELPQLLNILLGDMSFVGPRPDVPGYADELEGEDLIILSIKPGITGPATLKFKNENELLSVQQDPLKYNDDIIWKEKVRMNKEYVESWSFLKDLYYMHKTIFP